jgi:alpha-ketoglutarate-dependent taurine dioxygenase
MASSEIVVRKLTPTIGAEIEGVDLSRRTDEAQFALVHQALLDNLVIFFRDQQLTHAQHKAFAQRFGKLHIHPAPLGIVEGHPEVIVIKADENSARIAGEVWHSDVSCDAEPPLGSILHIQEVPAVGGDTLFASMYAAYEAMSDSMRRFLCGLSAIHDGARNYDGRQAAPGRSAEFPRAEHPVVRTHPETGRNALFVNRMFTTRIVQLSQRESDDVLQMLFRHIENPEFQCRFRWQANSMAFWDNRCAQHQAVWDYFPQRRYGHRVTIAGDKPFYRA